MSRVIRVSTVALLASIATSAAPLSAQYQHGGLPAPAAGTPSAPPAPMVGDMAPDFSAPIADAAGAKSARVSLAGLHGHVVVVAFYPKDRTVFVVGKDGKIAYRELRFNPVDQHAYDALKDAIEKAKRA
jgi:hypothetical protein